MPTAMHSSKYRLQSSSVVGTALVPGVDGDAVGAALGVPRVPGAAGGAAEGVAWVRGGRGAHTSKYRLQSSSVIGTATGLDVDGDVVGAALGVPRVPGAAGGAAEGVA